MCHVLDFAKSKTKHWCKTNVNRYNINLLLFNLVVGHDLPQVTKYSPTFILNLVFECRSPLGHFYNQFTISFCLRIFVCQTLLSKSKFELGFDFNEICGWYEHAFIFSAIVNKSSSEVTLAIIRPVWYGFIFFSKVRFRKLKSKLN